MSAVTAQDYDHLVTEIAAARGIPRRAASDIVAAQRPDIFLAWRQSFENPDWHGIPVPNATAGAPAPAAPAAGQTYEAVLAQHQAAGLSPGQAHLATARAHPDLHRAWLARVNGRAAA